MKNAIMNSPNLERHQSLVSNIEHVEIIEIDSKTTVSAKPLHTMIFILSGDGNFLIVNEDHLTTFDGNCTNSNALFVQRNSSYQIIADTKSVKLLIVDFDLFAVPKESFKNINKSTLVPAVSLTVTPCTLPFSPLIELTKNEPIDPQQLINLMADIISNENHSNMLFCNVFETFLMQCLDIYFQGLETTLAYVSAVAFTSPYDMPTDFDDTNLWFSDVEFWSNNPETHLNAILLFKAETEHKYIERPKEPQSNFTYYRNEMIDDKHICQFTVHQRSQYKLWFFPEDRQNNDRIFSYKDTCHIRFLIKSNYVCKSTIKIYNLPTYRCLSYIFDIKQSNTWLSFTIPLFSSFSESVSSTYVQNALTYIHENYQKKLSLEDIANHVHIHPSYLSSLFRKNIGQSVNNYVIFYRIIMAKAMLSTTHLSIEHIAVNNGFYDTQHFFKTFKKHVGMSPSDFRNKNKSKTAE